MRKTYNIPSSLLLFSKSLLIQSLGEFGWWGGIPTRCLI
jgi:hypothetical protein